MPTTTKLRIADLPKRLPPGDYNLEITDCKIGHDGKSITIYGTFLDDKPKKPKKTKKTTK